jgi:hypothetical protein
MFFHVTSEKVLSQCPSDSSHHSQDDKPVELPPIFGPQRSLPKQKKKRGKLKGDLIHFPTN